jgi:hypothetical protein
MNEKTAELIKGRVFQLEHDIKWSDAKIAEYEGYLSVTRKTHQVMLDERNELLATLKEAGIEPHAKVQN